MKKYVLCRPRGGLNDTLCQISRCYEYCKRYERILLIDTHYGNFINAPFEDIFTFSDSDVIGDEQQIRNVLSDASLSVCPKELKCNFYNCDRPYRDNNNDIAVKIKSGTDTVGIARVSGYLNSVRTEDIIIDCTDGGGKLSFKILCMLTLHKSIIDYIVDKYNMIKKPYVSIHIRNTDYKMDYVSFYNNNKNNMIGKNIFLATDSTDVKTYFLAQDILFFNFAHLNNNNKPLHNVNNPHATIDTMCDLILLALGDEFILPPKRHGFTNLAYYLFQNKNIAHKMCNYMLCDTTPFQKDINQT